MIKHIKRLFGTKKEELSIKKDLNTFKDNIVVSFSNIKKDMEHQRKWIEHLHSSHKQIDGLHTLLHDKHNHHQRLHKKDIDNINNWIAHLSETSKKQEIALKELESNVSLAFENYNKYLIDIYKVVVDIKHNSSNLDLDDYKRVYRRPQTRLDVRNEIKHSENYNSDIISKPKHGSKGFEKMDDKSELDYESKPTLEHYSNVLTPSEKGILAELCKTSQKLSYKDLAIMAGTSSNTIKNHICHIRNKGFPIKEQSDKGGIKRYYVPDSLKKILISKTI